MDQKFNKLVFLLSGATALVTLLAIVFLVLGWPSGDYEAFLDELGMRESSGNYRAENRYGYLGRYQMGEKALQDAGFLDEDGGWTDRAREYGIHSGDGFLNAPEGQEAAIRAYHRKLCQYIAIYGLDAYYGKTYCGVKVTESGLLAACHLVGARSMRDALAEEKPVHDANGVAASVYMRLFSGYDISEVSR